MSPSLPPRENPPSPRIIAGEHRELDALFACLGEAMAGGDRKRALKCLTRLQALLEVHFERESSLYFPTLASLRPDASATLASLEEAHERFREELDALGQRLGKEPPAELMGTLAELREGFTRHEAAEEELLQTLEREQSAGR